MYDADAVLDRISDNTELVLALGTVALVCNYIFFTEAARGARRDRCVPFLLIVVALWFPHDANYLLDFDQWFNQYDHWFPKLFWVALIFTNAFEILFITQFLRYGREEFAPRVSQRDFSLFVLGAVVLGIILWKVGKDTLDDGLYLMTFMVTAVWALVSGPRLALSRGTNRGQSVLMWGAYTGMITSFGVLSIAVFGEGFDDLPWIAMCVAAVVGGLGMTWWLSRAPAYRPAQDAPVPEQPAPVPTEVGAGSRA